MVVRKIKRKIRTLLHSIFGRMPGSYGQDRILRAYLKYPAFLPLNAQIQHGWYNTEITDLDREAQIAVMLVWSKRLAGEWRKYSKKEALVLGSPFILYRELHDIKKKPTAKGTVVFPTHSTSAQIEKYDADEFCAKLESLPEHFKPVTICLHHRDMELYGPTFSSHGFPIVTAGDSRQSGDGFVRKFYEILSSHLYCCSNEIGSYTFYAVDMDIPFFLYGPESVSVYRDDENRTYGKTDFLMATRNYFTEVRTTISDEQRSFVDAETGKSDRLDQVFLRKFFLKRFFLHELPKYPLRLLRVLFLLPLKALKMITRPRP